jgi:hypothetical protein
MPLPVSDSLAGSAPGRARLLSGRRPGPPRAALTILSCAGLAMLSGCSGRSSFLSGGPTVGQMKTSLAHLEYDNAQMKREVAKLRRENRAMEDRLVQEEQDSGELAARLDDARNLLRDRGVDPAARADAGRGGFQDDPEGAGGARTLPAGQTTRKRRKPPVARISGAFTPAVPDRGGGDQEDTGLGPPQSATNAATGADQPGLRFDDDVDHHTYYTGPLRWTPIAGRASDTSSQVR